MMTRLMIAMLCHAANAAYCASLGDDSQKPWQDAPAWQQESALKGVDFVIDNPNAPASANHDAWMAEKTAAGWVFGEVKDPDAKPPTHPCMVAFDDLPPSQQFKDVLFRTIVTGCVPALQHAAALEADLGKAKLAAKAVPAPKAAKPRKLGPVADPMDRDATMAAIVAAETVEIAFSDGKQEIAGLPPFAIEGNAWRMSGLGVMLTTPLRLHGPAREQAPYSVGGYALILDGKLAAFSKRSDPIVMAAGSTFDLTNEVFFG